MSFMLPFVEVFKIEQGWYSHEPPVNTWQKRLHNAFHDVLDRRTNGWRAGFVGAYIDRLVAVMRECIRGERMQDVVNTTRFPSIIIEQVNNQVRRSTDELERQEYTRMGWNAPANVSRRLAGRIVPTNEYATWNHVFQRRETSRYYFHPTVRRALRRWYIRLPTQAFEFQPRGIL